MYNPIERKLQHTITKGIEHRDWHVWEPYQIDLQKRGPYPDSLLVESNEMWAHIPQVSIDHRTFVSPTTLAIKPHTQLAIPSAHYASCWDEVGISCNPLPEYDQHGGVPLQRIHWVFEEIKGGSIRNTTWPDILALSLEERQSIFALWHNHIAQDRQFYLSHKDSLAEQFGISPEDVVFTTYLGFGRFKHISEYDRQLPGTQSKEAIHAHSVIYSRHKDHTSRLHISEIDPADVLRQIDPFAQILFPIIRDDVGRILQSSFDRSRQNARFSPFYHESSVEVPGKMARGFTIDFAESHRIDDSLVMASEIVQLSIAMQQDFVNLQRGALGELQFGWSDEVVDFFQNISQVPVERSTSFVPTSRDMSDRLLWHRYLQDMRSAKPIFTLPPDPAGTFSFVFDEEGADVKGMKLYVMAGDKGTIESEAGIRLRHKKFR